MPSLSEIRNQVKSGKYNVDHSVHNTPTNSYKDSRLNSLNKSTPPVNNKFRSKLGTGLTAGTLGAGALGAAALSNSDTHTDGIGSHFHNAFSNIFGMHENEGVSVSSSSEAMPSTGGNFPILKDNPIDFKERLKNLKLRRMEK